MAQNKAAPMKIIFQTEESINFASLLSQKQEEKKKTFRIYKSETVSEVSYNTGEGGSLFSDPSCNNKHYVNNFFIFDTLNDNILNC